MAREPMTRRLNINRSRRRTLIEYLAAGLLILTAQVGMLGLLNTYLSGLSVDSLAAAVIFVLILSLANSIVLPPLIGLSVRTHPLLFPVLIFLLNGLLVQIIALFIPGVTVSSIWVGIVVSLILSLTGMLAGSLLAIDDYRAYERFVVYPLRRRYGIREKIDSPGLMFLEIDGLSEAVLQKAIQEGYMPTVQRWLESGSHKLTGWETDLSSQTGASQSGILHGNNFNVPAFRWYEKDKGKLYNSTHPDSCAEVERRVSDGNGLMAKVGSSRANMYSGDAPETMLTFSTLAASEARNTLEYFLFFANPYMVARSLGVFISHFMIEVFENWSQVARNERPRVKRAWTYPFVRATATGVLREITVFALIGDMLRGLPAMYATLVGYDEVAHHSGVARKDALRVLTGIDRMINLLERISQNAGRPYRFVVLSDHGQSNGATFRQLTDKSLEDVVRELIDLETFSLTSEDETWNRINSLLTDVSRQSSRSCQLVGRAVRKKKIDGMVMLGPEGEQLRRRKAITDELEKKYNEVIVLASGNLGLIYFTAWKDRLSLEQINDTFPNLIPGLLRYPEVGFVMVHSEAHGPVVIGAHGTYYLKEDRYDGKNPLLNFGPLAAQHLLREDSFSNVPDIMINSFYNHNTGEVAAFEELVGSHGGLGGDQSRGILIYPAGLNAGSNPIVGAGSLHRVLKSWVPEGLG